MDELLARALQGVDLGEPDASWQIFTNLMAMMPWWELFWFTVLCVGVGMTIAWYRGGSMIRAVFWALLLGPFGWLVSWHQVPAARACPRCGTRAPAKRQRCARCGCAVGGESRAPKSAS